MATGTKHLWTLVRYRPEVDPEDLADAIQDELGKEPLDYRTRLLIRDSLDALRQHWGEARFREWLLRCPSQARLESIAREEFERPGFPSLARRLMEKTDPEAIRSYFRELGTRVSRPLRLSIGGSAALILPGYLSRATEDIDVVDEVPAEIRSLQAFLQQLEDRYGLKLAHFQRHYLPTGWEQRLHSLESFGPLQVSLVDVHDVFLSKLFSIRDKDLDDMRLLSGQLDRGTLTRQLRETTASMLAAPDLRQRAEKNWYILFGEALPT
jgi:hypothetical protein